MKQAKTRNELIPRVLSKLWNLCPRTLRADRSVVLALIAASLLAVPVQAEEGKSSEPWGFQDSTATSILHEGERWYGRPTLTKAANGNWLMAYKSGTGHNTDTDHWILRCSNDEGETWSTPNTYCDGTAVKGFPVGKDNDVNDADALLQTSPDGTVVMTIGINDMSAATRRPSRILYSEDNGRSWTPSQEVKWRDMGEWSESDLLLGQGGVTVGGVLFQIVFIDPKGAEERSSPYYTGLARSRDNGKTWEFVANITEPGEHSTNEAAIAHIGETETDYDFVVLMRDTNQKNPYRRYISDANSDDPRLNSLDNIGSFFPHLVKPKLYNVGDYLFIAGGNTEAPDRRSSWFFITDKKLTKVFLSKKILSGSGDSGYAELLVGASGENVFYAGYFESNLAVRRFRVTKGGSPFLR